ncbi:hypothetical protein B0H13DRAFT_2651944 [Mycena leptocephala]|nr:hypothetical protein B0H13DRAFT_2651944 [Mycena leptocephala]
MGYVGLDRGEHKTTSGQRVAEDAKREVRSPPRSTPAGASKLAIPAMRRRAVLPSAVTRVAAPLRAHQQSCISPSSLRRRIEPPETWMKMRMGMRTNRRVPDLQISHLPCSLLADTDSARVLHLSMTAREQAGNSNDAEARPPIPAQDLASPCLISNTRRRVSGFPTAQDLASLHAPCPRPRSRICPSSLRRRIEPPET